MSQISFRRRNCKQQPPPMAHEYSTVRRQTTEGMPGPSSIQTVASSGRRGGLAYSDSNRAATSSLSIGRVRLTLAARSHSSFKMWIFRRTRLMCFSRSTASHTSDTVAFLDNCLPAGRACVRELSLSSSVSSGFKKNVRWWG